ncbi:DUF4142 domain-containing protein [Sorangium cellulosum]|uniref:DUF4142 domain-containing protein n=1 Tax=Sorangium cellulosum TaxID=56 RepID=UPI003D9A77AF
MLRNRSGRLVAIMFAGSIVLAGAGGCIAGADEAETDREATAGGDRGGRDNTGADGQSGGRRGEDRQSRAGGRERGGEQAGRQGGQQGGGQAGYQGGHRGGGGQRAGAEQGCGEQAGRQGGEQAGYQGGHQGGRGQSGGHSAMRQVSDQELATLVSLINQQEVKLSKIALEKAESPEVQRYAEEMIDEHSRAEQHGVRLSRGATTSIEACPQCQQLQADTVETSESLREQEGAEFDVAFIWAQVSLHRRALEILDQPIAERTKSASLRSQVMKMRSDIEQHLRRAEQLFCTLLQTRQQQSGQQQGAQQSSHQKSPQQQGPQAAQQQGPQSAQQQGPQSAQQQGPQSAQQQRGQQQGDRFQGQQQRGQQHGAQFQGQQQRGQQHGARFGQQSAQQQGPQSAQQQRGQQHGGQSQGQQYAQQGSQR